MLNFTPVREEILHNKMNQVKVKSKSKNNPGSFFFCFLFWNSRCEKTQQSINLISLKLQNCFLFVPNFPGFLKIFQFLFEYFSEFSFISNPEPEHFHRKLFGLLSHLTQQFVIWVTRVLIDSTKTCWLGAQLFCWRWQWCKHPPLRFVLPDVILLTSSVLISLFRLSL